MLANVERERIQVPPTTPASGRQQAPRAKPNHRIEAILRLQRTAGNQVTTTVLQRATDRTVWDTDIDPKLGAGTMADFVRDNDQANVKVAKNGANYYQKPDGAAQAQIANVNTFLGGHTWSETVTALHKTGPTSSDRDTVSFASNAALHSNVDLNQSTVGLDVQDVQGDKHNLLHYTTTPFKTVPKKREASQAREQGHHLTVENAHLLFLLTLQKDKTLKYLDKTTLDKPAINAYLNGEGVAGIDNINFFPETQESRPLGNTAIPTSKLQEMPEEGADAVDKLLSLDDYMRFVAKVTQGLAGVSPIYAAKILHSLQVMQGLTKLNPTKMFLKVGKGDQRQVLRTLVTVAEKGLAPTLVLPPNTLATFRRYIEPKPYLPASEPVGDDTEWIVEAGLAAKPENRGKRYNDLEPVYVAAHYPNVIAALKTYLG